MTIEAVKKANKVAEVCICYTGNLLTSEIYNVDYYCNVARQIVEAGAHVLAIKVLMASKHNLLFCRDV